MGGLKTQQVGSEKTDNKYLKAIIDGDNKIIREIYDQYFLSVVSLISRYGGGREDAADIFQDAIMVIFHKARQGQFKLTSSFHTYLYAVCNNLWRNRQRKKSSSEVTIDEAITYIDDTDLEKDIERQELRNFFNRKFALLGEDCQKLLRMFFDGEKMSTIAQKMNYGSESYAKKRKFTCKKKLIELIESDPDFGEFTT